MSAEALNPEHPNDLKSQTNPERLPTQQLLTLTDRSMSDAELSEGLAALIAERDLTRIDSPEARARFILNSSLVAARTMFEFADLPSKTPGERQQTLHVTSLASTAELTLNNMQAQGKMGELREAVMDGAVRFMDTNILRAIKVEEHRVGKRYKVEIVRTRLMALLMLQEDGHR